MSKIKPASLVDHPQHYNSHPSGVECITIVEWMTFNVGNAVKYLFRGGLKDGQPIVLDLEKAAWYINREVERVRKMTNSSPKQAAYEEIEKAATAFGEDNIAIQGRLLTALSSLKTAVRSRFRSVALTQSRSILSDDKSYQLEWRLRPQPDQPPSDQNPQMPTGVVVLSFVGNPEDATSDISEKIIL